MTNLGSFRTDPNEDKEVYFPSMVVGFHNHIRLLAVEETHFRLINWDELILRL